MAVVAIAVLNFLVVVAVVLTQLEQTVVLEPEMAVLENKIQLQE
jgi:hypothetical protein